MVTPKDWTELAQCERSDTAVLLGSGRSINRLKQYQWKRIVNIDTWAMNNWVYHPWFVPNYYMIETKWYGYDLLKSRITEKWSAYKLVRFLFPKDKTIRMKSGETRYMRDVVQSSAQRYEYRSIARDPRRESKHMTANYPYRPGVLTKSYDSSITVMLELLERLGYRRIILAGVDLDNGFYFWSSGHAKYGKVHHRTNKEHEGRDPRLPHNTAIVKDFIIDFARSRSLMQKCEVTVATTQTALYPFIPLTDWSII